METVTHDRPGQNSNFDETTAQATHEKAILPDHHLDNLESWLDGRFRVPGTSFRFGIDSIIGLIPGMGDLFAAALSLLFVADAYKVGARKRVLAAMVLNILFDTTIGAVPIVGDIFDFIFKSNTKNLKLLKKERQRIAERLKN